MKNTKKSLFNSVIALLLCFTVLAFGFSSIRFSSIEAKAPLSLTFAEESESEHLEIRFSRGLIHGVREAIDLTADALRSLPLFVRDAGALILTELVAVFELLGEAELLSGASEI